LTAKDIAIATGLVLLMSINLIVQKIGVGEISIFLLSFLRVALVTPLLFFYPRPKKSIWQYSLCGFFVFAFYLILFNLGLKETGANVSAFLTQLQVFFGILAFYFILNEKPTLIQAFGIFISSLGVYFLSASSSAEEFPLLGVLFMIASCAVFGVGMALTKKYKIGGNLGDVVWMASTATIPLMIACLVFEGFNQTYDNIVNISLIGFSSALFASIVITLFTACMWFALLQRAPGSSVMPFMLLCPLFAIILSYFTLEESFSFHQFVAGFIILLGVVLAQNVHMRIPVIIYWVKNRIAL
jgi:O-acetylserine/cysteine efflux transporter